jgi:dephospho-CoA kinase
VDFHRVVVTTCPRALQISRLRARGLSEVEAEQRLAAQMSAEEKAARGDFVIRTDGTFEQTAAQVDTILKILRS